MGKRQAEDSGSTTTVPINKEVEREQVEILAATQFSKVVINCSSKDVDHRAKHYREVHSIMSSGQARGP